MWSTMWTVVVVYLVAVMIPGPNFLAVVSNSLAQSRRIGVYTALGIACGTLVHTTAGFLGLTAIIWRCGWLFGILKWVGATYLIYTGYKVLTSQPKTQADVDLYQNERMLKRSEAVKRGFYTCLSNPKSAIFYLSLFTVVIPPSSPYWSQIVMALVMIIISVSWYASLALLFSHSGIRHLYARCERFLNYLVGGVFMALGMKIAFARE